MGNITTSPPLSTRGHPTIRSLTSKAPSQRRVRSQQGLVPATVPIPILGPGLDGQTLSVPKYLASGRLLVALRVETAAMAPDLETGDLVAVSLAEKAPIPGDLVAVVTPGGEIVFRRLIQRGSRVLIADARGREHAAAAVRLLGVVVHVAKAPSSAMPEVHP